jgi:hypothetical protein
MNQIANRGVGARCSRMCAQGNGSCLLKSVSPSSEAVRNVVACAVEKELPKVKG